jgi:hypothetical protein
VGQERGDRNVGDVRGERATLDRSHQLSDHQLGVTSARGRRKAEQLTWISTYAVGRNLVARALVGSRGGGDR